MNYPKMLYKGDKVNFDYAVAETDEHEEQLKEQGWIEHSELGEPIQVTNTIKDASGSDKELVSLEEYEAILNERNEALTKITELEKVIKKGSAENIELHRQLRTKELEGQSADELKAILNERNEALTKITELEKVIKKGSAENIELHRQLRTKELEGQSADELKAILNERGVTFGARDSKPELVQLVLKSEQE